MKSIILEKPEWSIVKSDETGMPCSACCDTIFLNAYHIRMIIEKFCDVRISGIELCTGCASELADRWDLPKVY